MKRRSDCDQPEGLRWQFLLLPAAAVMVAVSGWVALALAISGLFLVLGLTMVQISALIIALRPNRTNRGSIKQTWLTQGHAQPRVSIHVPCCNEPPEVVMGTLDSLAQLEWNNYEVICLDNNTEDPAMWQPLQAHCRQLGDRFRVYHFEGVPGAKAGAHGQHG